MLRAMLVLVLMLAGAVAAAAAAAAAEIASEAAVEREGCDVMRSADARRSAELAMQRILLALDVAPAMFATAEPAATKNDDALSTLVQDDRCVLHPSRDSLFAHQAAVMRVGPQKWQCKRCEKMFRTEFHLHKHIATRHHSFLNESSATAQIGADTEPVCLADLCGLALPCGPLPSREVCAKRGERYASRNSAKKEHAWCFDVHERDERHAQCERLWRLCLPTSHVGSTTSKIDTEIRAACDEAMRDECAAALRTPFHKVDATQSIVHEGRLEAAQKRGHKSRGGREVVGADVALAAEADARGGTGSASIHGVRRVLGALFCVALVLFYVLREVSNRLSQTAPDLVRRTRLNESSEGAVPRRTLASAADATLLSAQTSRLRSAGAQEPSVTTTLQNSQLQPTRAGASTHRKAQLLRGSTLDIVRSVMSIRKPKAY